MEILYDFVQLLQKHRVRIFFSSLSVFWGVFMLVILLSSGLGLENGVIKRYEGININSVHIYPGKTSLSYHGINENRQLVFNNQILGLIRHHINGIHYISGRASLADQLPIQIDVKGSMASVYGVEPDYNEIRPVLVTQGRAIMADDEKNVLPVIMVGNDIIKKLAIGADGIGKIILLGVRQYKVIGIFTSKRVGEQASRENNSVFIPLTTFQETFGRGSEINSISIVPVDPGKLLKIQKMVVNFLKNNLNVNPEDDTAFEINNTQEEYAKFQSLFKGIDTFLWIVGVGTLFSGIIAISNIMSISVNERKKELAVRKALGAKPYTIVKSLVIEALLLTGFAGYAGLSCGLMVIGSIDYAMQKYRLNNEFFMHPCLKPSVTLSLLIIIIISGVVSGYIPAKNAAKVKPARALKED